MVASNGVFVARFAQCMDRLESVSLNFRPQLHLLFNREIQSRSKLMRQLPRTVFQSSGQGLHLRKAVQFRLLLHQQEPMKPLLLLAFLQSFQVQFDGCFKILWANHGDDISIQYSGTPALKGDFVRFLCDLVTLGIFWFKSLRTKAYL